MESIKNFCNSSSTKAKQLNHKTGQELEQTFLRSSFTDERWVNAGGQHTTTFPPMDSSGPVKLEYCVFTAPFPRLDNTSLPLCLNCLQPSVQSHAAQVCTLGAPGGATLPSYGVGRAMQICVSPDKDRDVQTRTKSPEDASVRMCPFR